MYTNNDSYNRLAEIRDEIQYLLSEADNIIKHEFKGHYDKASDNWISNIKASLGSEDHNSMCSFSDTIEEIAEECIKVNS